MQLRILLATALLALAGCRDDAAAPSREQDREMNEVADMLNQAPNDLAPIDDSELLGDEGGGKEADRNSSGH